MTNMLNWPAWSILGVEENDYDYCVAAQPQTAPTACVYCGTVGELQQYGTREQRFMDLPIHAKRVGIYVPRRRFRCKACARLFIEPLLEMDDRHYMTRRLVERIKNESLNRTFVEVADMAGIDEKTVRLIFQEHTSSLEQEMQFITPACLGLDELYLLGKPRGILTNIEQRTIFDLLKDRNKATVKKRLAELKQGERVEIVTVDMWRPYREAVQEVLPQAQIVVDKFHVVRMANDALEVIRKGLRASLSDKRRRTLKKDRYILLRRRYDLDAEDRLVLETWTKNFPLLGAAYQAKEDFFDVWDANDRATAEARYCAWREELPRDLAPSFAPLTTAIENWHVEIFNYFDTGLTNAYTEALNGLAKQISRIGRGYSFEAIRAKMLFSIGLHKKYRPPYSRNWHHQEEIEQRIYGTDISTLVSVLESGAFDTLSTTNSV